MSTTIFIKMNSVRQLRNECSPKVTQQEVADCLCINKKTVENGEKNQAIRESELVNAERLASLLSKRNRFSKSISVTDFGFFELLIRCEFDASKVAFVTDEWETLTFGTDSKRVSSRIVLDATTGRDNHPELLDRLRGENGFGELVDLWVQDRGETRVDEGFKGRGPGWGVGGDSIA